MIPSPSRCIPHHGHQQQQQPLLHANKTFPARLSLPPPPPPPPQACCCAPNGFLATDDKTKRALGWCGRKLSNWPAKIGVLVLFAGLIGGGAYGFSQMQVAGDVNNFIPPGSYLESFVDIGETYMNTVRQHSHRIHWDSILMLLVVICTMRFRVYGTLTPKP